MVSSYPEMYIQMHIVKTVYVIWDVGLSRVLSGVSGIQANIGKIF